MKKRSIKVGQRITLPSNIGSYTITDLVVGYQENPDFQDLDIVVQPMFYDNTYSVGVCINFFRPSGHLKRSFKTMAEAIKYLEESKPFKIPQDSKDFDYIERRLRLTYRLFSMYHWRMMK